MNAIVPESFPWSTGLTMLAGAALKGALLLAAAVPLSIFLRRASAATRHLVWGGTLVGALLLPAFSILLPAWPVSWIPNWNQGPAAPFISPPTVYSVAVGNGNAPVSTPDSDAIPRANANPVVQPEMATIPHTPSAKLPIPAEAGVSTQSFIMSLIDLLWLAGVGLALAPLLLGWWQVARLTRGCSPVVDSAWLDLLQQSRTELNLRRPVRMLVGPGVATPLTWGAWQPVLLLPPAAIDWPAKRRRVVLLHELAHMERWDWLTQLAAHFACALHWFNPLAWWAAQRMRVEREQACDDLVLQKGTRASDYADELLAMAASLGGRHLVNWIAVPMAQRSSFEGRVLAILDRQRNRAGWSRMAVGAVLGLLMAALVPMAMLCAATAPSAPLAEPTTPTTQNGPGTPIALPGSTPFVPGPAAPAEVLRGKIARLQEELANLISQYGANIDPKTSVLSMQLQEMVKLYSSDQGFLDSANEHWIEVQDYQNAKPPRDLWNLKFIASDEQVGKTKKMLDDVLVSLAGDKLTLGEKHPRIVEETQQRDALRKQLAEASTAAAQRIYQNYLVAQHKLQSDEQMLKNLQSSVLAMKSVQSRYEVLRNELDAAEAAYTEMLYGAQPGAGSAQRFAPRNDIEPQYKVLAGSAAAIEQQLNVLSSQGWEIASTSSPSTGPNASGDLSVILKRMGSVSPHEDQGPMVEWLVSAGGNGHFYQAVACYPKITWEEAQKMAAARGGYLATVTSAAESKFVLLALDSPLFKRPGEAWGFWIGGIKAPDSKQPDEGWSWLNGEGGIKYTNWAPGEPNNAGGHEDRLEISVQDDPATNGTWNDASVPAEGFVIEYDTKPSRH